MIAEIVNGQHAYAKIRLYEQRSLASLGIAICVNENLRNGITDCTYSHWNADAFGQVKSKAILLQAFTGLDGSRRLRLPDFKTFST
jgi:hypothetical protein